MGRSACCNEPITTNIRGEAICTGCNEVCDYYDWEPDATDDRFPTKEEMRDRMIEYQKLK